MRQETLGRGTDIVVMRHQDGTGGHSGEQLCCEVVSANGSNGGHERCESACHLSGAEVFFSVWPSVIVCKRLGARWET